MTQSAPATVYNGQWYRCGNHYCAVCNPSTVFYPGTGLIPFTEYVGRHRA